MLQETGVLVVLPYLCLILLIVLCRRATGSTRRAIPLAACAWAVYLTFVTELLSLFQAITFATLAICWTAATLASGWFVFRYRGEAAASATPKEPYTLYQRIQLSAVGLLIVAVAVVAWMAPPNTWDSMSYHMSRVMHWQANQSVAHYPTHIDAQLYHPPFAEFSILHLQILSGGDRWANSVQFLAMLGGLALVSVIAEQLGGNRRVQVLSVIVAATIPAVIFQATGTQNNCVVAFWLLCFVHFLLHLRTLDRASFSYTWVAGAAVSLGLLAFTKGSSYALAAPFVVWFVCEILIRHTRRAALAALLFGLLPLLINVCHFARNYSDFGNCLVSPRMLPFYRNDTINPSLLASNVIRNVALHLVSPKYLLQRVTSRHQLIDDSFRESVQLAVTVAHSWLNLGVSDPRITFGSWRFTVVSQILHEDLAANPLHLLLIVAALLVLAISWGKWLFCRSGRADTQPRPEAVSLLFAAAVLASGLLFCACYKWQPFHGRLHLPLFVVWAPFVGLMLARIRPRLLVAAAMIVLLIGGVGSVCNHQPRPLSGPNNVFARSRIEQYFANRTVREPYQRAIELLAKKGCRTIGLFCHSDQWEYPLWVLAHESGMKDAQICHIHARGWDRAAWRRAPARAIIVLGQRRLEGRLHEPDLPERHDFGEVVVFTSSQQ